MIYLIPLFDLALNMLECFLDVLRAKYSLELLVAKAIGIPQLVKWSNNLITPGIKSTYNIWIE